MFWIISDSRFLFPALLSLNFLSLPVNCRFSKCSIDGCCLFQLMAGGSGQLMAWILISRSFNSVYIRELWCAILSTFNLIFLYPWSFFCKWKDIIRLFASIPWTIVLACHGCLLLLWKEARYWRVFRQRRATDNVLNYIELTLSSCLEGCGCSFDLILIFRRICVKWCFEIWA